MSTIKAIRNGIRREFSKSFWQSLPGDKFGWVPAADVPDVIKPILAESETLDKTTLKKQEKSPKNAIIKK